MGVLPPRQCGTGGGVLPVCTWAGGSWGAEKTLEREIRCKDAGVEKLLHPEKTLLGATPQKGTGKRPLLQALGALGFRSHSAGLAAPKETG